MQFDKAEFDQRIARLTAQMRLRNLDAVLLDDSEACAYFFGFETSLSYYRAGVITADGQGLFVLRELDSATSRQRSWVSEVIAHADWEDPVELLASQLWSRGLGAAQIGIDMTSHAMSVQTFHRLKSALPRVNWTDLDRLPWLLRLIKSPAEIALLQRAAGIADQAVRDIAAQLTPGLTERDLTRLAEDSYIKQGGDAGHPGTFGIRQAGALDFLHAHQGDTPIGQGDVLHIEINPRFAGYGARMMRAMSLGRPDPTLVSTHETMIALQDRQFDAMCVGNSAAEADRIMRDGAVEAGLRADYPNVSGYTMGYFPDWTIRASDFTRVLLPNADWLFEAGMAFHVYTSADGLGVSETVHITPTGCERLTRLERKLLVVD